MQRLSMYFNQIDDEQADRYAGQALEIAEMGRDRKLMAFAYLNNGRRYLNTNTDAVDKIEKAMDNFRQVERIAREKAGKQIHEPATMTAQQLATANSPEL
jgi:hypothetical protein